MKVLARRMVPMLMALMVATACGSASSPVATTSAEPTSTLPPTPTPTSTPQSTPSPLPTPTAAGVLDDGFGILIGSGVRRESNPDPVFVLDIGNGGGVVSPDGRRLAFWANTDLRVIDIARNARARTLLSVSNAGEYALYMAWSSDGTGIVVGVNGAPRIPAADAPPAYTAVRVVDVAGGAPREVARVAGANVVPLAWDRDARLIAAYEPICCGTANYDTITEDGVVNRTPPGSTLYFLQASQDAKHVFGRNLGPTSGPFLATTLLRVWPVGAFDSGVELRSTGDEPIRAAEWRPGTAEIGVLFNDRLELWTPNGTRRSIALPNLPPLSATSPNATLLFRADGTAVMIGLTLDSGRSVYVVALDLASGRTEVVQWGEGLPGPGTSVRVGP
jgi:hypothetical protein